MLGVKLGFKENNNDVCFVWAIFTVVASFVSLLVSFIFPLSSLMLSKPYLGFVLDGGGLFSFVLCSSHPALSMASPHVYR